MKGCSSRKEDAPAVSSLATRKRKKRGANLKRRRKNILIIITDSRKKWSRGGYISIYSYNRVKEVSSLGGKWGDLSLCL